MDDRLNAAKTSIPIKRRPKGVLPENVGAFAVGAIPSLKPDGISSVMRAILAARLSISAFSASALLRK